MCLDVSATPRGRAQHPGLTVVRWRPLRGWHLAVGSHSRSWRVPCSAGHTGTCPCSRDAQAPFSAGFWPWVASLTVAAPHPSRQTNRQPRLPVPAPTLPRGCPPPSTSPTQERHRLRARLWFASLGPAEVLSNLLPHLYNHTATKFWLF